jgi:transposase-like protein
MEFLNNALSARQISRIFTEAGTEVTMRTVRKARQGHVDALTRVRDAINSIDRETLQSAFEKELDKDVA